jgi:hypothetical protein
MSSKVVQIGRGVIGRLNDIPPGRRGYCPNLSALLK